jgi:hypothetical protein
MVALAFFTVLYYPTHLTWWAFVIALLISAAWMVGFIPCPHLTFLTSSADSDWYDPSHNKCSDWLKRLYRVYHQLYASWATFGSDELQGVMHSRT